MLAGAASFDNITKYMQKSTTFHTLFDVFSELIIQLNLGSTKKCYDSIESLGSKVNKLLENWKSSTPQEATLQNLLIALNNLNCNDTAQCLINEYEKAQQPNQHQDSARTTPNRVLNADQNSNERPAVTSIRDENVDDVAEDHVQEEHTNPSTEDNRDCIIPLLSETHECNQLTTPNQTVMSTCNTSRQSDNVNSGNANSSSTNGDSTEENLKKISEKNVIFFIITVFVTTAILLAFLLGPDYKVNDSQENLIPTFSDTKFSDTKFSDNTITTHFTINTSEPIIVKSCNELTQVLRVKAIAEMLYSVIQDNVESVWKTNETISNMHCIKNLTIQGSLNEYFISKILENATSLYELHFKSWCDKNCTSLEVNKKPVLEMSSVRVLKISNYSTCYEAYLNLIRSHQMINIQDLRMIGGVIDNEFIGIFEDILKQLSSLHRLEISMTISTLNPIFLDIGSSSVQELSLNLSYLYEKSIPYSLQKAEYYFCKVFNQLTSFYSREVDIPLKALLQCKNLQIINTTFFISGNDTIPDLSLLKMEINSLTNATIYIRFNDICPTEVLVCIDKLGLQYLVNHVTYLKIRSNCFVTKKAFSLSTSTKVNFEKSFPC